LRKHGKPKGRASVSEKGDKHIRCSYVYDLLEAAIVAAIKRGNVNATTNQVQQHSPAKINADEPRYYTNE
jgi:hypothetical protein